MLTAGKGQAPCSPSSPCSLRCAWLRVAPRVGLRPPSPPLCAGACRRAGRDEGNGLQWPNQGNTPLGASRSVLERRKGHICPLTAFRRSTGLPVALKWSSLGEIGTPDHPSEPICPRSTAARSGSQTPAVRQPRSGAEPRAARRASMASGVDGARTVVASPRSSRRRLKYSL